MWTSDLRHIMWGRYGNGFFVGTDNLGKRSWGIFGKGFFAGFYDGEFFWGKYHRGLWAARGLFGERHARGKYVVSPTIALRSIAETRLNVSPVETANSMTPMRSISISRASPATTVSAEPLSKAVPDEVERLRRMMPEDLKKAESQVRPLTNRYLMWTHNLKHIMWGYYRNGFFVGTDNHGKRSFGIYGNGFFAGFYGEEFFWGRYRSGYWRAENLFGKEKTCGRYVTAPAPVTADTTNGNSP